MENSTLYENSILQYLDREDYIRILWIDIDSGSCYVINPFSSKIEMWVMSKDDLISEINIKNLIYVEDPFARSYEYESLTEKEKRLLDNAYRIVQYVAGLKKEPDCYDKKKRRVLVIEAAQKYGVSEKTVYKYLRKYWQGGKTRGALLPDFDKCGNPGKKKAKGKKKRGRPRNKTYEDGIARGINLNEEILEIFRKTLKKHYMDKNRISLQKTYDLMLKDYFTKDIGGKTIVKGINEIPSFGQFKSWYYATVKPIDALESRIGEINTRANYKSLNSDSLYETPYPGYRYQLDATIGDVYLVSSIDRNDVVGRPVVYLVVDTFSRMIVGVNICLEGPSWDGAAGAIYNCIEDKVEYCKKYDVSIEKEDWNVDGLPSIILGDRGEMVSTLAEGLISLGISVENTPSYMGCAKGIVEQYFHVINSEIKAWLPGEVKKDYRERGTRDYKKDAILDIGQFTKIVILAVLKRNRDILKSYTPNQEMINDEIILTPNEIWNWGMKNSKGKLRTVSKDILRASLMRKGRATVLREGIKFNDTFYISEKAEVEEWFSTAQIKGHWNVDIAYDRRNMDIIYIKGADGNYSIEARIKKRSSLYELIKGKTYEEIASYFLKKNTKISDFTDEHNQLNLDMNIGIERVIEEAKNMSDGEKNNVKNIKENRKKEKERLWKEDTLIEDFSTRYNGDEAKEPKPNFSRRKNEKNPYIEMTKKMLGGD